VDEGLLRFVAGVVPPVRLTGCGASEGLRRPGLCPVGASPPQKGAKTRLAKPTGLRYAEIMTAEAILQKSVRYDRSGKPLEVVISYEEFVDFVETYGLDLSDDEKDSVREAQADREAGRIENFVALEDLEKELGI
jgi:hypothetical protein